MEGFRVRFRIDGCRIGLESVDDIERSLVLIYVSLRGVRLVLRFALGLPS